jgi:hypothetical protein
LVLVSLDWQKSTIRAVKRFKKTGRYVPLGLIFDGYSNEPILSYYRIKNNYSHLFESIGKISTDVEEGKPPVYIESTYNSPVGIFK